MWKPFSSASCRPRRRRSLDSQFSTMGCRRDRRAPVDLTDAEREWLKNDPSILKQKDTLTHIRKQLKDRHSSIDETKREILEQQRTELAAELHAKQVRLYRDAKRLKRRRYFDTVTSTRLRDSSAIQHKKTKMIIPNPYRWSTSSR